MTQIINTGVIKIGMATITHGNVAVSASDYQQLTPPEGYIYKIICLNGDFRKTAGSSSGTNNYYVQHNDIEYSPYLQSNTAHGSDEYFQTTGWLNGGTQYPTSETDQINAVNRLFATHDQPLEFRHYNDTDVQQTGSRAWKVLYLVYRSVE